MYPLSRRLIIFRYFFINYFRSRSFYFLLFLVLIISSLMTFASLMYFGSIGRYIVGGSGVAQLLRGNLLEYFWGFFAPTVGFFAALFFGSSAIAGELEEGTANFTFTLPVDRRHVFAGKFLAAYAGASIICAIYYLAGFISYLVVIRSLPNLAVLLSYGLLLVFVLAMLSVVFLLSAVFRRTTYVNIAVLVLYFIMFNSLTLIWEILYRSAPEFLINNTVSVVYTVYVGISFQFTGLGGTLQPSGFWPVVHSILIMLCYAIGTVVPAALLFEWRESS